MGGHELAGRYVKGPNHLRNAHRHIHEGRNVVCRSGTVARAGARWNHGGRDDAGRGFPREIRLGLRRCKSFCALAPVRNAG